LRGAIPLRQVRQLVFVFLLCTSPSLALQVDGVQMTANGTIGFSYAGGYGDGVSSTHALGLSLDSQIQGYYYNPKFLSFTVTPYYNRSQSNGMDKAIGNSRGFTASVGLFSGSNIPGNVYYSRSSNSSSTFGIPGTLGLESLGSESSFGFDWDFRLAKIPDFTVTFQDSNGSSEIPGLGTSGKSNQKLWIFRSQYMLKGFRIVGDYRHSNFHSETDRLLNGATDTLKYSYKSDGIGLQTGHAIPLGGSFSANYNFYHFSAPRPNESADLTGSTHNFSLNAHVHPGRSVSLSGTAQFYHSSRGGIQQFVIDQTGEPVPVKASFGSSGRSFSASASWTSSFGLGAGGGISHATASSGVGSVSVTQYSGVVTYFFTKRLLRGLSISGGLIDTANKQGNNGANGHVYVSYRRRMGRWKMSSNFSYTQNLHTLGIIYTTSGYSYGVGVDRVFSRHKFIGFGMGAGHTGLTQGGGVLNHSETFFAHGTYEIVSVHLDYLRSYGQGLRTSTGIVGLPSGLPPSSIDTQYLATFHGESESASLNIALIRNLDVGGGVSKSRYDSFGLLQDSTLGSTAIKTFSASVTVRYRFRKMYFAGGYHRLEQQSSPLLFPASTSNSFYIGVSRWFSIF
jgi:hypothetical protein